MCRLITGINKQKRRETMSYRSSKNTTKRPACPFTAAAKALAMAILAEAKAAGMKIKARGSCAGLDRPYARVDHDGVTYLVTAGYVDPHSGRSCGPAIHCGIATEEYRCAGSALAGRIQPPRELREVIERAYAATQAADPAWDENFAQVFYPYD